MGHTFFAYDVRTIRQWTFRENTFHWQHCLRLDFLTTLIHSLSITKRVFTGVRLTVSPVDILPTNISTTDISMFLVLKFNKGLEPGTLFLPELSADEKSTDEIDVHRNDAHCRNAIAYMSVVQMSCNVHIYTLATK